MSSLVDAPVAAAQMREASLAFRLRPPEVPDPPAQRLAIRVGEKQRVGVVTGPPVEMPFDLRNDLRRQCDDAAPGLSLRGAHDAGAVPQLEGLLVHSDRRVEDVDVPAAEGKELAEAEPSKRGQDDHHPAVGLDRIGEGEHLWHGCHGSLGRPLDT